MQPTHAIFDLDGTLLDTEPLYSQAAQAVVGRYDKVYDWEIKRNVLGGDPHEGARFVVSRLGLPLSPEEYLREREALMRELCAHATPRPGAAELVRALHARGVPLAIGTSSDRALCEVKLAAQPFARLFDAVVCSDDARIGRGKPAPDIFLACASLLRAPPERCLVFEDSPKGVQAAVAAGMQVIAVPDPRLRELPWPAAVEVLDGLDEVDVERFAAP